MTTVKDLKILIVEDDVSLLKIMSSMLARKGGQVFEAENGQQALQVLASNSVDLVLSDVQMPIMDGVELLLSIRKNNPELPVVMFVTGQAQLDENESIRLGSSGLLRKPVKMATLIEKIQSLIDSGDIKPKTAAA